MNGVSNFNYIDTILNEWNKKGYRNKEDIIKSKNTYKEKKKSKIEYIDGMLMAMPLEGGDMFPVFEEDTVSMNMFGFTPHIFDYLERRFPEFLDSHKEDMETCEYLIPTLVFEEIENKTARVEVLKTDAVWQGITYKEDKPNVVAALKRLHETGVYPDNMWK